MGFVTTFLTVEITPGAWREHAMLIPRTLYFSIQTAGSPNKPVRDCTGI